MYVTVEPKARMWTMMMTMILKVCLIIYYFVTIIIIIIITYREITISGVVPKCKSDNTTPSLTRPFERRSLFHADYGCNGWRMMRGSQCAKFEVHTVDGREDINNLLLLICYKGGALWDIISQYTYCF